MHSRILLSCFLLCCLGVAGQKAKTRKGDIQKNKKTSVIEKPLTQAVQNSHVLLYSAEIRVRDTSYYEVYNHEGKKIFEHPVHWVYSNTWNWIYVLRGPGKFIDIYDSNGNPLGLDSIEETREVWSNTNRLALRKNGKWGFYTRQAKLALSHHYDHVGTFYQGKAAVSIGNDTFLIDSNGTRLDIPYNRSNFHHSFEEMSPGIGMEAEGDFYNFDVKVFEKNGRKGIVDLSDSIIIPAEYEDITGLQENFNLVTVKLNGLYGVLRLDRQMMIPVRYISVFVINPY